MLQSVFDDHVASPADSDVERAVREDTVIATRLTAVREVVLEISRAMYAWTLEVVPILMPLALATVLISRGPGWLELVLVVGVLSFALLTVLPADASGSRREQVANDIGLAAVVAGVIALLVLLARPVAGVGLIEGAGAVLLAIATAFAIAKLSDQVISRFIGLVPATLMVVALVTAAIVGWQFVEVTLSRWLDAAFVAGAIAGAATAGTLAMIELGYQIFYRLYQRRKFTRIAEAEFTQQALWVIGGITHTAASEDDPTFADRTYGVAGWERSSLVNGLDYLAQLLQHHIPRVLIREDPADTQIILKQFAERAEAIHAQKRAVLFGVRRSREEVLKMMKRAVLTGAQREWHYLAVQSVASDQKESRSLRARRIIGHAIALGVPIGIAVAALVTDQRGLIPLAAIWAAVSVVELITPGAGAGGERGAAGGETGARFASVFSRAD